MSIEVFEVSNVKCGGCATIIQDGLQGLVGVDNIQVDIAAGIVAVGGGDLDRELLQNKLAELGYPVK